MIAQIRYRWNSYVTIGQSSWNLFYIGLLDQVNFVGVQLVIRSILTFFLVRNYEILLNTAVLPWNLFDPKNLISKKKRWKLFYSRKNGKKLWWYDWHEELFEYLEVFFSIFHLIGWKWVQWVQDKIHILLNENIHWFEIGRVIKS